MIIRRILNGSIYLLLFNDLGADAFAQNNALLAPLSWTRDKIETQNITVTSNTDKATLPKPAIKTKFLATTTLYNSIIQKAACKHQLDPRLLHAMIQVESGYDSSAISAKGATGLMQVMPATARRFGYTDMHNVSDNIEAGAAYLKWLLEHFDNDLELSIAAYNAGEGAVKKHGMKIPPYRETQNYVAKVLLRYKQRSTDMTDGPIPVEKKPTRTVKTTKAMRTSPDVLNIAIELILTSPATKETQLTHR